MVNLKEEAENLKLKDAPERKDEFQGLIDQNWDKIGTLDDVGYEFWFEIIDTHLEFQFGVFLGGKLV